VKGRLRLGLIIAGVLLAVAIALWPVSRQENIYKTEPVTGYSPTWGDPRVPTGATRTVSCGAAALALNKRQGRCDQAAKTLNASMARPRTKSIWRR
jgi:hypothetical protein